MSRLVEQLELARAEVRLLEERVAKATTCGELGCDMKHVGGRNAGCGLRDCCCSIPVYACTRCGDSDYGDNDEAETTVSQCLAEQAELLAPTNPGAA